MKTKQGSYIELNWDVLAEINSCFLSHISTCLLLAVVCKQTHGFLERHLLFLLTPIHSSLLPLSHTPPRPPGFQGTGAIETMAQIYINELKHSSGHNPKLHSQYRPVCCFSGIQIRDQLAILIKV